MRQLLQSLENGAIQLVDAPAPAPRAGELLIHSGVSLVSAGTERMLAEFGRAGLIGKAMKQPAKVKQVLQKVKTDGLVATVEAVRSKLGQPIPLGYCNVGTVRDTGGVPDFAVGDRIVSNGPHAELVRVPKNLCARVPDGVSDEQAAFTVVAAIALHGIRLAEPTLGENFAVIGTGLVGLLAVQLLRAQGCRVLAIDPDPDRLKIARDFGAETCQIAPGQEVLLAAQQFSRGRGIDGAIICASTDSSDPVHNAAQMCRKRGRIVLVGATGMELDRSTFFEKELGFQVSCSYGPGRYDPDYEEGGQDYPLPYVRWTEQRNFEAVLDLMAAGRIDVEPLVTHRIAFDDAASAYDLLTGEADVIGILLQYPEATERTWSRHIALHMAKPVEGQVRLGAIGAGNYAERMLLPALKATGVALGSIVSSGGGSARRVGTKLGFSIASSDVADVIDNDDIDAVVIATRHDSHADLAARALASGKHVFVEKPLALTADQLDRLEQAYGDADGCLLMAGFNRRFAPLVADAKKASDARPGPKQFVTMMNAGVLPADHWLHDPKVGGGRIIGEACHHVDLLRFLAGSPIRTADIRWMDSATRDNAVITLTFADGSIGSVHYCANGGTSFAKERVEIFAGGGTIQIDNFRKLKVFDWAGLSDRSLLAQDKGQRACAAAFVQAVRQGARSPIPADELFEVAHVMIDLAGGGTGR